MKPCKVKGCHRPRVSGNEKCMTHWGSRKRSRPQRTPKAPLSLGERLMARVARVGTHWLWTGQEGTGGYGKLKVGGRHNATHRLSYQAFVGPIPEGFAVHHKCGIALCINPEHLEAVSPSGHKALHAATARKRGIFDMKTQARLLLAMHEVGFFEEDGQLVGEVRVALGQGGPR